MKYNFYENFTNYFWELQNLVNEQNNKLKYLDLKLKLLQNFWKILKTI